MRVGVQGADRSDLMGHVATDRLLNASLLKLDSQIEGRERDRIRGTVGCVSGLIMSLYLSHSFAPHGR